MLDERLLEHIDDIARPLTLDEIERRVHALNSATRVKLNETSTIVWDDDLNIDELPNDLGNQKRSRALLLAVAAVLGLIVGGVTIANLSNDDLSVATDNRGEAAPELPSLPQFPSLPGDFSTARWREIPMPFNALRGDADVTINGITTSSDGVAWAVGEEMAFASDAIDGALSQPAIWRSGGGGKWEPVDLGLDSLQSVQDDTFDVSTLTHVVTTDDGVVWAFGSRLNLSIGADGGPEAGTSLFAPIGYRTVDGETWTALEVPGVGEDPAGVFSVSASGNDVVVTVQTADLFAEGDVADEQSASFASTDGLSWTQVSEPSPLGDIQHVVLDEGSLVSVFDSDLPGESPRAYRLVAGPDFFITSGIDSEALSNAEEDSEAAAAQRLWFSSDGEAWQVLDVQLSIGSLGSGAALFPHSGGMLSTTTQAGVGDSNTLLVNIDASGFVEEVAELPTQGVLDIFTLDGRLHLLDQSRAPELGEAAASQSIWVAEFMTPDEAPASASEAAVDRADRMIGEDPFLGDPLVESFFASSPEAPAFLKVEPPFPLTAIEPLDASGEGPIGVGLTYSDGEREALFCVLADELKDAFSQCDGLDLVYIAGPNVKVFGAPTDSPDGDGFFDDWAFNPLLEE